MLDLHTDLDLAAAHQAIAPLEQVERYWARIHSRLAGNRRRVTDDQIGTQCADLRRLSWDAAN